MLVLVVKRDTYTARETVGVMTLAETKFQTMERPWIPDPAGGRGGKPFESCVAPGLYRLERHTRPSGEKAFILSNPALDIYQTPNEWPKPAGSARALCLIHAANWAYELHGCLGPGLERSYDARGGQWMVSESRAAMNQLRTLVNSDLDLQLRIDP